MTPKEQEALAIVERLNREKFADWFWRGDVMAVIEAESSFDPGAIAGDGLSEGLMQVRASTAAQMGVAGSQLDPETSVLAGMSYLRWGWQRLEARLGRDPKLEEWFAGYNSGYEAALEALDENPYGARVLALSRKWVSAIGEG